MRPVLPRLTLALIVVLLLGQFALRAHRPAALPAFVDEYSHITRARVAFEFDHNPMRTSHGKLLLYYWMGLFGPHQNADGGLILARWAVALFSLIGSAAAAAVARDMFGRRAMIPALAFYALLPWALFFDRMALADSFAGALAALAAWGSLRIVRHPTRSRGGWAGLLITLASLAKLTTGLVVLLPPVAALLFDPARRVTGWGAWLRALWTRYRAAWTAAALVFGITWLILLAAAIGNRLAGNTPIVLDTHLVDARASTAGQIAEVRQRLDLLISTPMTLALAGMGALALVRSPRRTGYVLIWLLLLWLPTVVLAATIQSRYLVAGLPALAALFGGGIAQTGAALGEIGARRARVRPPARATTISTALLAVIVIGSWAAGFALPFAANAHTNPAALVMPDRDTYDYFRGSFAMWGTRQGLDYVRAHGERIEGRVPVVGVVTHCGTLSLHVADDLDWSCLDRWRFSDKALPADVRQWEPLMDGLDRWPFVYLITEYTEHIPFDTPPGVSGLVWELQYTFLRPDGGIPVTVWRVTAR